MYTYNHYQFDYIKPINQSTQKSKLSNAKPVEMHVPKKNENVIYQETQIHINYIQMCHSLLINFLWVNRM